MKSEKLILTVAIAFVLGWICNYTFNDKKPVRDDFREKLLSDTLYITKTDTLPPVKGETVIKYINVPVPADSGKVDSVPMQVVQRTYSDDSTYTAYVSGVAVDSFPRLDSIKVTQRTIIREHEIEHITTKYRPITFGLHVGTGYGITTRKPDIYIGLGIQYNF